MSVSYKDLILITYSADIIYGMYVINGVYGPEPRSSGGNASSNPQVSALIPRLASKGMERMCQRLGNNYNSHLSVLVRKPLHNPFIHYHTSKSGVLGINHFKLCNFAASANGNFTPRDTLCMGPANERRHFYVTSSPIGPAHPQEVPMPTWTVPGWRPS